jgi:site-specific DNA-cytosine methylase
LDDDSTPGVYRARGADANADYGLPNVRRRLFQGGAQRSLAGAQDRRWALGHRRSAPDLGDSRSIVNYDGSANVRAAEVEREYGTC